MWCFAGQADCFGKQAFDFKNKTNIYVKALLKQKEDAENFLKEQNKVLMVKFETLSQHSSHSHANSFADFSSLEYEISNLNEKISESNNLFFRTSWTSGF